MLQLMNLQFLSKIPVDLVEILDARLPASIRQFGEFESKLNEQKKNALKNDTRRGKNKIHGIECRGRESPVK